ncbi:unnamed protein product [Leuciscus chuanchicus]
MKSVSLCFGSAGSPPSSGDVSPSPPKCECHFTLRGASYSRRKRVNVKGGAVVSADNPQEWHTRRRRQRAGGSTDPPVNSVAVGSRPAVSCGGATGGESIKLMCKSCPLHPSPDALMNTPLTGPFPALARTLFGAYGLINESEVVARQRRRYVFQLTRGICIMDRRQYKSACVCTAQSLVKLWLYYETADEAKLVPGAWDEERRGREVVTGTTAALRRSSARERLESWCGSKYSGVTGWDEKINIALLNLGYSSSSGAACGSFSLETYWDEDRAGVTHQPPAAGGLDGTRAVLGWGQAGEKQGWVEMERGQVS